jgi:predicted dehydrogenase
MGVAIIGAGSIAEAHLYAYQKVSEEAQMVAVVDIVDMEEGRAQRAAERFGPFPFGR